MTPGRSCLPFTPDPARSLLPTPFPLRHLVRSKTHLPTLGRTRRDANALLPTRLLAQKFLAYPVAPAPPPFGRPLLPTLSSATTRTCQARARVHRVGRHFPGMRHSHRAFCRPAASITVSPCPPEFTHAPGRHGTARPGPPVVEPGMLNLTKSLFLSPLTLHFPSGKALSPSRAPATKSRGDPPVNARLLGGPFHWEI